jgi:hypothetical protein
VLATARHKLEELETQAAVAAQQPQIDLFTPRDVHPLLQRLAATDADTLSPRDAQALLYELVQQARDTAI